MIVSNKFEILNLGFQLMHLIFFFRYSWVAYLNCKIYLPYSWSWSWGWSDWISTVGSQGKGHNRAYCIWTREVGISSLWWWRCCCCGCIWWRWWCCCSCCSWGKERGKGGGEGGIRWCKYLDNCQETLFISLWYGWILSFTPCSKIRDTFWHFKVKLWKS